MASITPFISPTSANDAFFGEPDGQPEELVLELSDVGIQDQDGKRRAVAHARLVYYPATPGQPPVASQQTWRLQAPLGLIEAEDLRWYLEKYAIWPGSAFAARKLEIERKLQYWGGLLYQQALQQLVAGQDAAPTLCPTTASMPALASEATRDVLAAWHALDAGESRRFSICVDGAGEAAGALLALPWELLHDGTRFWFQGEHGTRVRRRLPGAQAPASQLYALPIRVLVVSPRPEDVGYIDHRVSALPLVAAAEALPDQIHLHVLQNPSFDNMQAELVRAQQAGAEYHVIHFDGHGVYDVEAGQGALCFEHPNDGKKWENRRHQLVYADQLGAMLCEHRIALVFLEACQSAMAESATDSVATTLLQAGVASVVAMSHSVLVETSHRFVGRFYASLTQGMRVGDAMLMAQQYLAADTVRGKVFGEGEFHLQDWFVPVLYQESADPVLFHTRAASQTVEEQQTALRQRLGDTPDAPEVGFIGRSRELLSLQRRLVGAGRRYCVILGQGGEGKTTLAVECARWLVRSQQVARVAFVSVERQHHLAAVVDALGRQLVGPEYSVAQYPNLGEQCKPLERALRERATLLVLDNMESILPPPWMPAVPILDEQAGVELEAILRVMQHLMAVGETRVIFTSREALPAPFAAQDARLDLAQMDLPDAVALIERALGGGSAGAGDAERARVEQIEALAREVHCHARTLALLAPSLREYGVARTQVEMVALMEKMEREFPGEREKSLFASVELSLARLSPENRERVQVLGVFHGGLDLDVLCAMTDWPVEEVDDLVRGLLQTGLATLDPYNHLTLVPALCPWLRKELPQAQAERWATRWRGAMWAYVEFLDEQRIQDAELAATLTVLELANLFALLVQVERAGDAAATIELATRLYDLLRHLGKPQLTARAGQVRDAARAQLGDGWRHAHFQAARTQLGEQLATGQMQTALDGAQALLQQALAAGDAAYVGADYDCAGAHLLLGRVVRMAGKAQAALPLLQHAEQAFTSIAAKSGADSPNKAAAEGMASACLTEQANCLRAMGQLDAAATLYQTAIGRDAQLGAAQGVAVGKCQLADVYRRQKRYQDALDEYDAARTLFAVLDDLGSVATAWHQIGLVHEDADDAGKAEDAYRQSLVIAVRLGNVAGQANTLGQLGNLYKDKLQQPEQAVVFYQQALDKTIELGNKAADGLRRSNLADALRKLGDLPAARKHIRQAIACKEPFGLEAELWKSWDILAKIETAAGNAAAAQQAKQQASSLYLAYRRAGGENHSEQGRLCLTIQALLQNADAAQAQAGLQQLAADPDDADDEPWQALLAVLQALVHGQRDASLALDERLPYDGAAEITLLLETLPPASPAN